jgi:hypothetical protein
MILACAVVKEQTDEDFSSSGFKIRVLVGVTGLEPVTLRLSSACSNQLSYTPCHWWSWGDSNPRPTACKTAALPTELQPLVGVGSTATYPPHLNHPCSKSKTEN